MAILFSNNPSRWFETDGVYIAEQEPPASPRIIGTNTVRIVGEFPWGPTNEIVEINGGEDLLEQLVGEASSPQDYGGYRSLVGKTFGPVRAVRVEGAGAAKASRTIAGGTPEDIFSVTAKYVGAVGNELEVLFEQVSSDVFDLRVRWGSTVEEFLALDRATTAFDDVESEFVDFAWLDADESEALPSSDSDYVALTGGSDGTVDDTDFTGDASNVIGLRVFETDADGGMYIYGERAGSALITALRSHVADKGAEGVMQAATSDTFADNETAAGGVADDRVHLAMHRVMQRIAGTNTKVDLAPFVAAVWSQIPEHYSVADYDNAELLSAITGLPAGVSIGRAEWVAAQSVGGITLERLDVGGYKIHAGLTSDPAKPSMITRRMTDLVGRSLGVALLPYQNKPSLDLFVDNALAAQQGVLAALQGTDGIPQTQRIESYSVRLVSRTGTTVIYEARVKLWGEMRFLVLNLTVGANVVIEAAA